MNQFNIFLDFYRIIAEMTEEEIVSAIGSPKYRNTVESVRRIFLEQGEKAANEEKKKLPSVTFSANYRKAVSSSLRQLSGWPFQCDPCQISGIYRDRYRPFE